MQKQPLLFQAAEMYALCVCGGLFLRDMQIVIEKKLTTIAQKKGYINGEVESLIKNTISSCSAPVAESVKDAVLGEKEFIVAYRAFQISERVRELTEEIETQKSKIEKLQEKPDDFDGTKKAWLESQKENLSHERFVRDQKSQLRTQYQNEELTDYIEEKFTKEAVAEWKRTGGVLPEAAKEKRIEKLKTIIFHEDSADEQFYPTPANIIRNHLIPHANISDGMSILEPSAGKGNITDVLRELYPNSPIDAIELSPIRNEYLRLRGYNLVGTDFMQTEPRQQYDRIVMNPPFLRTVSIEHVTRAYKLFLKPGGMLVALINAGAFTNEKELDSIKFRKRLVEKYGTSIGIDVREYNEGIERPITVHIAVIVLNKPLVDEKTVPGDVHPTPKTGQTIEEIRNGKRYKVVEIGDEDFLARTAGGLEVLIDKDKFFVSEWQIIGSDEKYSVPERGSFVDTEFKEVGFITARADLTHPNPPDYVSRLVPADRKILDHVVYGANVAVQSLLKRGGFLNCDGTGTGKTAQQLLVADYFINNYDKPVLILTETDSIIEQSFFGDAKNLLGMSVPDARSEKVQREIKRPKKYKGLFGLGDNSHIQVTKFNPNIGLKPGINIGTYNALSLLDWDNEPLQQAYNDAKSARATADDYYAKKGKEIRARFGKNLSASLRKMKKDLQDSLKNERGNDARYAAVIAAESAWIERQRELLKVWIDGVSLIILDECQNVKNTGGNTLRANRAQLIIQDAERVAFFSATPADKAGDIFYLKRTGIYRSDSEFARLMQGIGYFLSPPMHDKQGRLIRRSEWKPQSKFPPLEKVNGLSRIFDQLTEDGGMLKRELQLTNLTSVMVDMQVPRRAHDLMDEIEEAITDHFCKKSDADRCTPPKALIQMEQKRALEPFKVQRAIEITKDEIAAGRNVVIFCDLVDDGEEEKAWGDKKEGVVRILKERLGEMYGDDMVGVVIGVHSEYEKQERFKNIQSFQKGVKRIVIATVGSGGTGISLDDVLGNAPRTMIIITAPLSSIKTVQVLGRIVRAKTRSRSTAYFLFGDVYIDEWLKNLLATKLMTLDGIVAGEVSQLAPKQIEAIEAGGEESIAEFITSGANSKTDADGKKKKQHKFFNTKPNDWIDGKTLPQNKPYSIRKFKDTTYYWDKKIYLQIRADSKANIEKFALMYASEIARYGFTRESDRYMGTYYKAPYGDQAWNFLLNLIKPEQQEYIVIPRQVFNVGDEVMITEDNLSYNIKVGAVGEVVKVRPRSNYYLYDVEFDGMLAQSIEQEVLTFLMSSEQNSAYSTPVDVDNNDVEEIEEDEYEAVYDLNGLSGLGGIVTQEKIDNVIELFNQCRQNDVFTRDMPITATIALKIRDIALKHGLKLDKMKEYSPVSEEIASVSQVPIAEIRTDEARFQPRERLIDENVNRIIENYNPIKFKPVTLWKDEQGRTTLIAGHHRLEAMKRMGRRTIPAVWFTGTGTEAEDFGKIDNAAHQRQLPQENAKYIRSLRERGHNETELKARCKSEYGMECTSAYFLSFLSPTGNALLALNSFPNPDTDDAKTVSTLATWTGKIKQNYPDLTNSQENEIYKFAFENFKKFGKKFNSYQEFAAFVEGVLDRKFFGGEPDETPINFANLKVRSETEHELDQRIEEARKDMVKAQAELHKRVMEIEKKRQAGENIPQETVDKVLGKYQDQVLKAERLYSREVLTKNERLSTVRASESTLFGLNEKFPVCPPRTESGEYCITPECIEQLEECIAAQPDTKSLWLDEEGDYVTERWELHNRIIDDIMKGAHCIRRDKPIAILTGGASGSGKSTFLKKFRSYLTTDNLVKIDIDSFRDYLPEYKGWNANATQSEVKDIYNRVLDKLHATECKYDIILDGTMNKSKNYIPLIERLKSYGYQVFVIYIKVTKETSEKRVRERYRRSGRYVPQFVIDEIFENGEAPMREIIKKTDGYIIVDNEQDGKIVERGGKLLPKDRKYSALQDDLSGLVAADDLEPSTTETLQTIEDDDMSEQVPDLTPQDLGYYDAKSIATIRPNYLQLNRTRELLDKIARPFRALIWGLQGSGKSSLSLMFSEDLSRIGKTLHVLTEEKIQSGRLGAAVARLNINARKITFNDKLDFTGIRNVLTKNHDIEFVVIDSINRLKGGSEDLLMELWEEFPKVSFVFVGQSTKDGKTHSAFPTLAFNVDTVVRVDELVAVAEKHRDGRSGVEFSVLGKRAQRANNKEMTFQGFKI